MSKKKTWLFVLGFIALIVLIVLSKFALNMLRAIDIAQNYLEGKYTQEMQFSSVNYSWIEPTLYYVSFSPSDNPDLSFEVMVQRDFTLYEKKNVYGYFSPDNYYIAYFEYMMEGNFQSSIKQIWDDKTYIEVRAPNDSIYAFKIPDKLSDKLPLEDMAPLINEYLFLIITNRKLDKESEADEAENILDFIEIVKASNYKPDRFVFWYNVDNNIQAKDGKASISIDNWVDISCADQIISKIDEEIFSYLSKSNDKYYKKYFTEKLSQKFHSDAFDIWDKEVEIISELNKESINEYKIANLHKEINIDDIEYKLKYGYSLEFLIPERYNNENPTQQLQEAENILNMIQIIKESGYTPNILTFSYLCDDNNKRQFIVFFARWGDKRWPEVDSIDSVIEQFNESLFCY